jgi:hypothetical protein
MMTELVNTSVATKAARHARPASLAMVAAVALSSTVPNYTRHDFLKLCNVDQNGLSATADLNLGRFHCDSASTEPKALNHEEAGQALVQLLTKEGFEPSRVERTADQSILFQFLGKNRACIDLYPSGELIVLVRKTDRDEIHELEFADSDRAIQLLHDAGIAS